MSVNITNRFEETGVLFAIEIRLGEFRRRVLTQATRFVGEVSEFDTSDVGRRKTSLLQGQFDRLDHIQLFQFLSPQERREDMKEIDRSLTSPISCLKFEST